MSKLKLSLDIKNTISKFYKANDHIMKSILRDDLAVKLLQIEKVTFNFRYNKYALKVMEYRSDSVVQLEDKLSQVEKKMKEEFDLKNSSKYSALVDLYCNLKDEQNKLNGRFF